MNATPPPNKPEWIWSIEDIFAFFDQADAFLSEAINTDDGDAISQRIALLVSMFYPSTNVCAAAKWYTEAAKEQAYRDFADKLRERAGETHKPLVAASVLKLFIESQSAEFQAMQVRADRLNAAITHTVEALRSILSRVKEERRIASYSANIR